MEICCTSFFLKNILYWSMHVCVLSHFSHIQVFATPWTVAHQTSLSMGFSSQEYWSGLPCPPLGDLPNPGIEPTSLTSLALEGGFILILNLEVVRSRQWA